MIARDLYSLETLASVLEARGVAAEPLYQCPGCPRRLPPTGIVRTAGLPGDLPAYLCHTCASGPHREALAAQDAAEREAAGPDWSGVRARRDAALARCDWTQGADAPLSETDKAAWQAYRQALRDLTATSSSPNSVVWPSAPG